MPMIGKWEVLDQRETISPDPNGAGFRKVVQIRFRTAGGNIGTVDVPRDGYNADAAREAIDAHAEQLDAVSAMGATS